MMGLLGGIDLETYLIRIVVLLFSISVHEWAHAYTAYRFGDDTAARQGRLTLNPIRHFEPIGFILILMGAPIAWAKPVPVNTSRFYDRVNIRRSTLIMALSGIVCNLLLAFFGAFLLYLMSFVTFVVTPSSRLLDVIRVLATVGRMMLTFNVFLAIFNFLPLPQLDGFELWSRFMPRSMVQWIYQNERIISTVMFVVIIFFNRPFGLFLNLIAGPIITALQWPWRLLFNLIIRAMM